MTSFTSFLSFLLSTLLLLHYYASVDAFTNTNTTPLRVEVKRHVRSRPFNRTHLHAMSTNGDRSSRPDILKRPENRQKQAIAMGILSTLLVNSNPNLAQAATAEPVASVSTSLVQSGDPAIRFQALTGNYADPNHPGCLRKIELEKDQLIIIGSDNIDGSNPWLLRMRESEPGKFLVDFSAKGGPKNLLGVYDGAAMAIRVSTDYCCYN